MSDKAEKPKKSKAKPKKNQKGVLAALPSTRAERIGTRRVSAPSASATPPAAKPAKPAAAKPAAPAKKPAAKKPAASKPARKAASPRVTATRRKAAAPRTFEPTQAAETAAGAADEHAAAASSRRAKPRSEHRPRAVRPGAPGMGTTGVREQPTSESGRPSGVDLVTTAVQAAGELTQIGLTIGGQIIKRAVNRLPKR